MPRTSYASIFTVAGLCVWAAPAHAQCTTDVECKGDRICESGACVDPGAAAAQHSEPPQSAPPASEVPPAEPPPPAAAPPPEPPPPYPPAPYPPAPYPHPGYPPPYPAHAPYHHGTGLDPRLLPAEAIEDWSAGDPIPPGYGTTTTIHKGLVIAGAVTFGALWLGSIAAATSLADSDRQVVLSADGSFAEDDDGFDRWGALYAPVVGPFIAIGTSEDDAATPYLVLDGVGQAGGLAMLILGLTLEQEKLQWVGGLDLLPLVGEQSGLAARGSF